MATKAAKSTGEYACIEVRLSDRETAEILCAEAFEAGAAGIEERESDDGIRLLLYAPAGAERPLEAAIERAAPDAQILARQPIVPADWAEQWKRGLTATEISPRLLVRPSFVEPPDRPGQFELVIDPAQAFGTGGHPSTHLTLQWIDALAPGLASRNPAWRMLDVGTGTGVLSLAALRFGASMAVAFDLDPLAAEATATNARANGIRSGLQLFTGTLDAVADTTFDLVVANLLRTELMPLIATIAARVRPGGCAVFAGLLRDECGVVVAAANDAGLTRTGERTMADANGEQWSALLMNR